MHTQNCDKKQYLFPQLGGGITQPHVIQTIIRFIHSSHNHKQWTRQVSGSTTASLLRPFYWVTNRCTDVAPVLGRGTDLSCTPGAGSDGELTVQSSYNTHLICGKVRLVKFCKYWSIIEFHKNVILNTDFLWSHSPQNVSPAQQWTYDWTCLIHPNHHT